MILCFYAYYCWYFLHKVPKVSFKQAQNTCLHRDAFSLKKNYSREGICLLSLCASYLLPTVFSLLSLIEYGFWFPRQWVYCRYGQLSLLSLTSLRLEIIFRLRIPISILELFPDYKDHNEAWSYMQLSSRWFNFSSAYHFCTLHMSVF